MAQPGVPWIDAASVAALLPVRDAVQCLRQALAAGLDPAADPPRTVLDLPRGQLLLMPASGPGGTGGTGVKLVTVAPGNAALDLPRIQGVYVLFDGRTLAPLALLDGAALTLLRTPALSALAVALLAVADARRLVVFGSGPQAAAHVAAVLAVRPLREVVLVARDQPRVTALAARLQHDADRDEPGHDESRGELRVSVGTPAAVSSADIVVCATTAGVPLFDGELVGDRTCVVAVGAHQPDRRELAGDLLARSTVVVEDRATALREAGEIALAVGEGLLDPAGLVELSTVVTGAAPVEVGAPRVFKSVGMAWQDFVVASEVVRRERTRGRAPA